MPAAGPRIEIPAGTPPHVDQPAPPSLELSKGLKAVLSEVRGGTPSLHDRCGPRVMDSTTLDGLVGTPPAKSKMLGLASTHYGAVIGALDKYHATLATPVASDPTALRKQAEGLVDNLMKLLKATDACIAEHGKKAGGKAVTDGMKTLRDQIAREVTHVNTVAQASASVAGAKLSWKAALAGANYRLMDSIGRNNDGRLDGDPRPIGSGAFNEVVKLKYQDQPEPVAFKPDPEVLHDRHGNFEYLASKTGIGTNVGGDQYRDLGCAGRNVATAFVNEALGARCAPHCSFAMHGGQIGIAMDFAKGTPAEDIGRARWDVPGDIRSWAPQEKAALMRGLIDMQFMDAICGQVDRHNGNYLVDQGTGTVTGVDNDICFGRLTTTANPPADFDTLGKWLPLPPLIGKPTADRIQALDFRRDLAPTLNTLLSPEEVAAAESRFNEVKAHVEGLRRDGMVVDGDWTTWTPAAGPHAGRHPDRILTDPDRSYVARDWRLF